MTDIEFEVIGDVLTSIPLIIEALEYYADSVRTTNITSVIWLIILLLGSYN